MTAIIEIRDLRVWYGLRPILWRISAILRKGTICCLSGPSGSGKTTLLRCLNRLIDYSDSARVQGEIVFDGQNIMRLKGERVDRLRAEVGMVFQKPVLFPLSIVDNLMLGAKNLHAIPRSRLRERSEELLRAVGLWDDVKDRLATPARTLSVGQQQRLCLARALAVSPQVLLLDEPTSSLDPVSASTIEALVLDLKPRLTVVWVTHDVSEATRLADVLWQLRSDVTGGSVLDETLPVSTAAPANAEKVGSWR